jgi:hypothetical protein
MIPRISSSQELGDRRGDHVLDGGLPGDWETRPESRARSLDGYRIYRHLHDGLDASNGLSRNLGCHAVVLDRDAANGLVVGEPLRNPKATALDVRRSEHRQSFRYMAYLATPDQTFRREEPSNPEWEAH